MQHKNNPRTTKEMFNAFGKIGWLMPLIAITEILEDF